MKHKFTEDDVELAALEWLGEIGYSYLGGLEIAPGEPTPELPVYLSPKIVGWRCHASTFQHLHLITLHLQSA